MIKFVTLALLGLCICNAAVQQKSHFVDTKSVLAEIDQDPFGNTFLSAIALTVSSKAPEENLMVLLQEIADGISNDQAQADEKNRTNQAICDEQLTGFRKQIDDQTATIAQLGKSIQENGEIVAQAKIDLELANKDYDETIDAIEQGTKQREEEHGKWTEFDYQTSIQVATLEEGVKLIQHMIHGVSFDQIKVRYDKVVEKLQDAQTSRATLFKPLISSLTQLATKLNYENVMKIIDLLQSIRASLIEEQAAAKIAEEKAQSDWQTLLGHLENQKQALSDKKTRLDNLIKSTETLLKQLKESLENHKVELENIQGSLASTTAWCDNESLIYQTETAERTRELEIINKLIQHITEKIGQVIDYVNSRL